MSGRMIPRDGKGAILRQAASGGRGRGEECREA